MPQKKLLCSMSEQNNGLPETTLQESNYKHVTDLYLRNFIAPDSTQFAEGMTMLNSLTLSTIEIGRAHV